MEYFFDNKSNKNDDGCNNYPHNNKFHIPVFWVNTFKTGIVLDIFKLALFFFSFLCTLASFYSRDEPWITFPNVE